MKRALRSLTLALGGLVLLAACSDSPVEPGGVHAGSPPPTAGERMASATVVEKFNEIVEVDDLQWVPCANDGLGEFVFLSGRMRVAGHVRVDGRGGMHANFNSNFMDAVGVGQVTGDTYRVSGTQKETQHFGEGRPEILSIRSRYRLAATGGGPRFDVEFIVRMVVDADGEVRVLDVQDTATCN